MNWNYRQNFKPGSVKCGTRLETSQMKRASVIEQVIYWLRLQRSEQGCQLSVVRLRWPLTTSPKVQTALISSVWEHTVASNEQIYRFRSYHSYSHYWEMWSGYKYLQKLKPLAKRLPPAYCVRVFLSNTKNNILSSGFQENYSNAIFEGRACWLVL